MTTDKQMHTPKRYSNNWAGEMEWDYEGRYIEYTDYEALQHQRDTLLAMLRTTLPYLEKIYEKAAIDCVSEFTITLLRADDPEFQLLEKQIGVIKSAIQSEGGPHEHPTP